MVFPSLSLYLSLYRSCFIYRGLMGTSKPVHYQCIWNENYFFRPQRGDRTTRLSKEALELLTFRMSFQYGSATKAPRLIPVFHYSGKLAESELGCSAGLETLEEKIGKKLHHVGDTVILPSFRAALKENGFAPSSFHLHLTAWFYTHLFALFLITRLFHSSAHRFF